MKTYSYGTPPCDHEVRYFDPNLFTPEELADETTFHSKIGVSNTNQLLSHLHQYLDSGLLKSCILRTLPLNQPKSYLKSIDLLLNFSICSKLEVSYILPFPNPNHFKISDFSSLLSDLPSNVIGFELISSWHGLNLDSYLYLPFISRSLEYYKALILEVDHSFRDSKMHLFRALNLCDTFDSISIWLPHLGCGAFLYPDVLKSKKCEFILLSSVPKSPSWIPLAKSISIENCSIAFASDTPYDALKSFQLYSSFFN